MFSARWLCCVLAFIVFAVWVRFVWGWYNMAFWDSGLVCGFGVCC